MPNLLSPSTRGAIDLPGADLDWLHQLIADWQVIADLSVSDLVLWIRTSTGRFVAAAHSRPATGATVHLEEVIGRRMPAAREAMLMNLPTRSLLTRAMKSSGLKSMSSLRPLSLAAR